MVKKVNGTHTHRDVRLKDPIHSPSTAHVKTVPDRKAQTAFGCLAAGPKAVHGVTWTAMLSAVLTAASDVALLRSRTKRRWT